ncbi:Uncharacterised protein [Pantoea agglomerans]|uniref:Uncharacterized protein n=1 Tax=Enterobacter agglomerans TaxID=549 RepID=A0A379LTY7_ENTAG|nr:Uncharacterised protein [Pantoea agglomerans]
MPISEMMPRVPVGEIEVKLPFFIILSQTVRLSSMNARGIV